MKVLIVDDHRRNADRISSACLEFQSKFNAVYETVVCKNNTAYIEAKEYLQSNKMVFDLLFTDYRLSSSLGTELFKYIPPNKHVYKVLHSITDHSIVEAQNNYRPQYDIFCESKSKEAITSVLSGYERDILSIKLFGNPFYHQLYFTPQNIAKDKNPITFDGTSILVSDILYARSLGGDKYELCFRDVESFSIEVRTTYKFTPSLIYSNLFAFRKVNPQLSINLLWVAYINEHAESIHFITPNNDRFIFFFEKTPMFNKLAPELKNITSQIPPYFTS
jgi:CheY-like chemotaxis protein